MTIWEALSPYKIPAEQVRPFLFLLIRSESKKAEASSPENVEFWQTMRSKHSSGAALSDVEVDTISEKIRSGDYNKNIRAWGGRIPPSA